MRRILLPAALLVAASIALAGCSAGSNSSAPSIGQAPGVAPVGTQGQVIDSNGKVVGSASGATAVDRQVVTTGVMTITAKDPLAAATAATKIVESVGGRIDGRNEYAPANGDKGSATLTMRLPADSLAQTLEKFKGLGDVQEISTSASDVTMQSQDLNARITALRASVVRLLSLLSQATDTDTLIKLETAISDRQANLESLESQQNYLADQVALSTITLTLQSIANAPVVAPVTFWGGLAAGWATFVAFFAGLLVVIGVLLPWLVLAAIITVGTIAFARRRRRGTPRTAVATAESATGASVTEAAAGGAAATARKK